MTKIINRREFLAMSAKGVGAAVISYGLMGCGSSSKKEQALQTKVSFSHGVASGDPAHDAVILWTRATPEKDGDIRVSWEVATDDKFSDIVTNGNMITNKDRDYTVKVDAIQLDSGKKYYYRFMSNGTTSTVGTTKTLPEGEVSKVKLAVVSCSNYPAGYFNVYELATQQKELDAVVHLGDYIYEYGPNGFAADKAKELGREVLPAKETISLSDYRTRYAQYRSDQSLQKLHTQVPFITVWDDHEVANDSWQEGAENHQDNEGDFEVRKQAALQAYFEWLPIRPFKEGNNEEIYRSFQFGNLVDLFMLDTRLLAKDKQLEHKDYLNAATGAFDGAKFRADITDTQRTMLGQVQLLWLQSKLLQSTTKWQVLGQQVLMGKMFLPAAVATRQLSVSQFAKLGQLAKLAERIKANDPTLTPQELQFFQANKQLLTPKAIAQLKLPSIPYNLDAWDGYAYEREVILGTAKSKNNNLVVLAGDTHNAWANELRDVNNDVVGVEFATASVSSPGLENYLKLKPEEVPATERVITNLIADLKYANLMDRGLMTVTFTQEKVDAQWHYVDSVHNRAFKENTARQFAASSTAGKAKIQLVNNK
ncbi:MAG: alkaline phosphatase D family protein [Parashewanella sp.]